MGEVPPRGGRSPLRPFRRGVLFEPAGDGAHEVLSAHLAFPVVGFAASGAGGSDVVGGFLECDYWHGEGGKAMLGGDCGVTQLSEVDVGLLQLLSSECSSCSALF